MQLNVNPNRMELLKLKRRLQFAVRGHKLLKDKQESLMQEFMKIIKQIKQVYTETEQALFQVYEAYYQTQAGAEPYALEEALEPPAGNLHLQLLIKNIFGRRTPTFNLTIPPAQTNYSPATAPFGIKELTETVQKLLPQLVFLAQLEKQVEMLAGEIEKTRRRVNALEYNLIPALEETSKGIILKLEERDRSERSALMKIKNIIRK